MMMQLPRDNGHSDSTPMTAHPAILGYLDIPGYPAIRVSWLTTYPKYPKCPKCPKLPGCSSLPRHLRFVFAIYYWYREITMPIHVMCDYGAYPDWIYLQ